MLTPTLTITCSQIRLGLLLVAGPEGDRGSVSSTLARWGMIRGTRGNGNNASALRTSTVDERSGAHGATRGEGGNEKERKNDLNTAATVRTEEGNLMEQMLAIMKEGGHK